MDHYLDIKVTPDGEFGAQMLMNVLFGKLHLEIVEIDKCLIGVSFPALCEETNRLGDRVRVHSSEANLNKLLSKDWLRGLCDYTVLSAVAPVPSFAKYRTVSRVQVKSNPEKERRRLMKRKNITEEEAFARIPDSLAKQTKLPFIQMKSCSSSQRFRLFIKHGSLLDEKTEGQFSAYGFSNIATIPWF